ncbi:MAG TPA: integrase, partial [Phaeodactylibacter sp.]|nr:integrase [Phaeodactylibacter sp.]
MDNEIGLEKYLKSKLSASSVKIYLFEINHFIRFLGKEKAATASYQDVQKYLNWLRKNYDNPNTIHRIIQAIKQYFFYLIEIKKREDHPCRYLAIKDRSPHQLQLQDFLKTKQLQKLLTALKARKERYKILEIRNQVVMSLLVNQALRVQEICALKVKDIHLKKGIIKIKSTPKTNARTLHLKPEQIMLLHDYLHKIRNELLKNSIEKETKNLIITKKGTAEKGEGIHYLVSTFRKFFPTKRLTPTTIRQSVIANLLASGNDLRIVQVFAGHKNPSTTEKYRQTNFEKL